MSIPTYFIVSTGVALPAEPGGRHIRYWPSRFLRPA